MNEDQKISKGYEGIGVSFLIKKYISMHQKLRENLNNHDPKAIKLTKKFNKK
ncbi:MAG: hypothetical protein ACFFBZ_15020 [Promethearchaeota archaeon]